MYRRAWIAAPLLLAAALAHADASLQQLLHDTLGKARADSGIPGLATLVQIDGRIEASAALGVRAIGHRQPVTLADEWHLGSTTKAMTATLIARLVEQGRLSFDDSMAKVFPDFAERMHPELREVTVAQLLTHTSGLLQLTKPVDLPDFLTVIGSQRGLRAQRAALAEFYLTHPPASKRGEFSYSNAGYVIAGAMAERLTGRAWEELIRSEVWKPLGIRGAGFGAPGRSGKHDQPRGHERVDGKYVSLDPGSVASDNPPALGPAGTVHMSLGEWLLFAQDQLDGEHGRGKLLEPGTYRRLHTPVTRNYAMGWRVTLDPDGSVSLLTHKGTNGSWIADVHIFPKRNGIVLTALNAGGDVAEKANQDIAGALSVAVAGESAP